MPTDTLTVAVLTEVFLASDFETRLTERTIEAGRRGADLVVLPELPFLSWIAASRRARDQDAEPLHGPSLAALQHAAAAGSTAVLGGAIVRDEAGRRFNTALLVGASGSLCGTVRKSHVPFEEGWWERAHYDQGDDPAVPLTACGWPVSVQICSDAMRPAAALAAVAAGAKLVIVPRATPAATLWRWTLVLRALAVTGAVHVISANRPLEAGTSIGGPSLAIDPLGAVEELGDPFAIVRLDSVAAARARQAYPGYLDVRSELYARSWADAAGIATV